MAPKQDANRLPAHLRRQLPLHRFGDDQAHTPPRYALWLRQAHHDDDSLALAYVQDSLFAGARPFVQCLLQFFLLIAPSNSSHRFRSCAHTARHLRCLLPTVKLAQNRSTPQQSRRSLPLGQHPGKLLPVLKRNSITSKPLSSISLQCRRQLPMCHFQRLPDDGSGQPLQRLADNVHWRIGQLANSGARHRSAPQKRNIRHVWHVERRISVLGGDSRMG